MFPPLSRPQLQIRGSFAYFWAERPARLAGPLHGSTMQNESGQNRAVLDDVRQLFLRQYYRMRRGKKQRNIKKPSHSRNVSPTSRESTWPPHRGLTPFTSRSPTQAVP